MTGEADELAALREAFPDYRFRRRTSRGVLYYQARARSDTDALLAAARSSAVLADMLAAAAGRPVKLRAAAIAAAYRDRQLTLKRIAIGPVRLDRLPTGKARRLSGMDLTALTQAVQHVGGGRGL